MTVSIYPCLAVTKPLTWRVTGQATNNTSLADELRINGGPACLQDPDDLTTSLVWGGGTYNPTCTIIAELYFGSIPELLDAAKVEFHVKGRAIDEYGVQREIIISGLYDENANSKADLVRDFHDEIALHANKPMVAPSATAPARGYYYSDVIEGITPLYTNERGTHTPTLYDGGTWGPGSFDPSVGVYINLGGDTGLGNWFDFELYGAWLTLSSSLAERAPAIRGSYVAVSGFAGAAYSITKTGVGYNPGDIGINYRYLSSYPIAFWENGAIGYPVGGTYCSWYPSEGVHVFSPHGDRVASLPKALSPEIDTFYRNNDPSVAAINNPQNSSVFIIADSYDYGTATSTLKISEYSYRSVKLNEVEIAVPADLDAPNWVDPLNGGVFNDKIVYLASQGWANLREQNSTYQDASSATIFSIDLATKHIVRIYFDWAQCAPANSGPYISGICPDLDDGSIWVISVGYLDDYSDSGMWVSHYSPTGTFLGRVGWTAQGVNATVDQNYTSNIVDDGEGHLLWEAPMSELTQRVVHDRVFRIDKTIVPSGGVSALRTDNPMFHQIPDDMQWDAGYSSTIAIAMPYNLDSDLQEKIVRFRT